MKIVSVVLCAGKGARLKSAKSKMLHEIGGRVVCYWSVKNAIKASSFAPIVVLNYQKEEVEKNLRKYFNDEICFVEQPTLNGTAGAVKAAISKLPLDCQSVLVTCGDTPLLSEASLKKLVTIQAKSHVPIAMLSAYAEDPSGYGRIVRNKSGQITAIVEEKEASHLEREINEINPGVYAFDAEFLRANIDKISDNNSKKEFYLTDLISIYLKGSFNLGPVESVSVSYEEICGINDRRQLAFAENVINGRIIDKWMKEGVSFIDPKNTRIEESVQLSADCLIYPGVHLRGDCKVAEGVIIENGAVIVDCIIDKEAHILPYSVCHESHIGPKTKVGPFARLRPGSYLEEGVKVGNFVEIKSSRLKKNAKASHLAYIGDASIGEQSNIGAGSITCNYDGEHKHHTEIGKNAFIGSNSTLIAPLSIGDGAYLAGGSTISKDVPKGALAFGRARQVVRERSIVKEKLSSVQQ